MTDSLCADFLVLLYFILPDVIQVGVWKGATVSCAILSYLHEFPSVVGFSPSFQRKNDQFREGHTSVTARSSKVSCPVAITEKVRALLRFRGIFFLVARRRVRSWNGLYFHKSLRFSYSTINDDFKK